MTANRVECARAHQPAATAAFAAKAAADREALIEDVEWLLAVDSAAEVARRLNRRPETIARRLFRAGRPDLAAPFERARDRRW